MAINPAPTPGKTLAVSHFPTAFQTVIFRLWECVSCAKLAEVLHTTEENVKKAAADMGLGEQIYLDKWHSRGYITILRAIWNVLPYEQILQLLDYTEERLKFILKEDDFLDYKLGEKCDCAPVYYRELTGEEMARTRQIKAAMDKYVAPLMARGFEEPFDFFNTHRYEPLCAGKVGEVKVDGSWYLRYPTGDALLLEMIEDFRTFAAGYGVKFAENGARGITITLDKSIEDEEYHEVTVTKDAITIRAGTATGALRGLYVLENQAERTGVFAFEPMDIKRRTRIKIRYINSFCGLYTDVLECDTRISFPDELLAAYGRAGVNGVWIQGLLSQLTPNPFMPEQSEGWEKRLKTLADLCNRCARYGVKVYMYINEPRQLPVEFFDAHPDMKGTMRADSPHVATLCSSHERVHQYLRDSMRTLCSAAPNLGGFIVLTQSENNTTCYANGYHKSHNAPKVVHMCPVCAGREMSDTLYDVLSAIHQGVRDVNDKINIILYAWCFSKDFKDGDLERLIGLLPNDMIYLQVSETAMPISIGGVDSLVGDYSLSQVGPSQATKGEWALAKAGGLKTMAKVQVNTSWECAAAPFLPVFGNVDRHISNLVNAGVENLMLSWTHGGYVGENLRIAAAYFFEDVNADEGDLFDKTLKEDFGPWADKVKAASDCFCQAFAQFPFSVQSMYFGPSNTGAGNLFYPEPSGMRATMTCYPYDDVERWRHIYPLEVYQDQYHKLREKWEEGLKLIEDMPDCEFKDMAYYGYTLFACSANQIDYVLQRDGAADAMTMKESVADELEKTRLALEIALRNSAVGYEAANHYYVPRSALTEKIVQCDYLLNR
ncbi:MAG: hypothetical protein IJA11_01405 [Oscillospiraceae bacterium]|nr:hypothetical protein [Oscillospiraceae bacterium]